MGRKKFVTIEEFNQVIEDLQNQINKLKEIVENLSAAENGENLQSNKVNINDVVNEVLKVIEQKGKGHKNRKKHMKVDDDKKRLKIKGKKIKVYDKLRDVYFELAPTDEIKIMPNLIYYIPHEFEDTSDIKLIDDFENKLDIIGISDKFVKITSRGPTIRLKDGTKIFV